VAPLKPDTPLYITAEHPCRVNMAFPEHVFSFSFLTSYCVFPSSRNPTFPFTFSYFFKLYFCPSFSFFHFLLYSLLSMFILSTCLYCFHCRSLPIKRAVFFYLITESVFSTDSVRERGQVFLNKEYVQYTLLKAGTRKRFSKSI
jgi:hypothetical protein